MWLLGKCRRIIYLRQTPFDHRCESAAFPIDRKSCTQVRRQILESRTLRDFCLQIRPVWKQLMNISFSFSSRSRKFAILWPEWRFERLQFVWKFYFKWGSVRRFWEESLMKFPWETLWSFWRIYRNIISKYCWVKNSECPSMLSETEQFSPSVVSSRIVKRFIS